MDPTAFFTFYFVFYFRFYLSFNFISKDMFTFSRLHTEILDKYQLVGKYFFCKAIPQKVKTFWLRCIFIQFLFYYHYFHSKATNIFVNSLKCFRAYYHLIFNFPWALRATNFQFYTIKFNCILGLSRFIIMFLNAWLEYWRIFILYLHKVMSIFLSLNKNP